MRQRDRSIPGVSRVSTVAVCQHDVWASNSWVAATDKPDKVSIGVADVQVGRKGRLPTTAAGAETALLDYAVWM